jgi:hypothetical protein
VGGNASADGNRSAARSAAARARTRGTRRGAGGGRGASHAHHGARQQQLTTVQRLSMKRPSPLAP